MYDFNLLEKKAKSFLKLDRPHDAVKIYLYMADGDQSLDGGYLGKMLGQSYEAMGDLHAAKYWYGRAVEENPEVRTDCLEALKRLKNVTIEELIADPPHD